MKEKRTQRDREQGTVVSGEGVGLGVQGEGDEKAQVASYKTSDRVRSAGRKSSQ